MFVLSASLGFSAGNVAKEISLNRKRPCPGGVQGSGARSCSVQAACVPVVILAVPPRGPRAAPALLRLLCQRARPWPHPAAAAGALPGSWGGLKCRQCPQQLGGATGVTPLLAQIAPRGPSWPGCLSLGTPQQCRSLFTEPTRLRFCPGSRQCPGCL